jgi:hypothetical protein
MFCAESVIYCGSGCRYARIERDSRNSDPEIVQRALVLTSAGYIYRDARYLPALALTAMGAGRAKRLQ